MNASRTILLVDDEESLARVLQKQLQQSGATVVLASTLAAARQQLTVQTFDLILLDLELPDGHGLDLLRELRDEEQDLVPVVVLTGAATLQGAVEAMRCGATDYLAKPEEMQETLLAVEKAMLRAEDQRSGFYARQRQSRETGRQQWIGESESALTLLNGIQRVAAVMHRDAESLPAVLLIGETGSGKNMAARLLHASSPRHEDPFMQVDCGSLPASLIEGELFGHDKGAFTQAHQARVGLMEAAERGVLFLDEIGEIPLALQAKLLAALDRRAVRRVGSNRETPIRAAIIAATNRDLSEMVAEGKFREDLYYRLHGFSLAVPALRDRRDDIPLLSEHLLQEAARSFRLSCPTLSPAATDALLTYDWPGNVRELKNILGRAVLLAEGNQIELGDLGFHSARDTSGGASQSISDKDVTGTNSWHSLTLDALERHAVEHALASSNGNVSEAARSLGISRGALRNRIQRFGLA